MLKLLYSTSIAYCHLGNCSACALWHRHSTNQHYKAVKIVHCLFIWFALDFEQQCNNYSTLYHICQPLFAKKIMLSQIIFCLCILKICFHSKSFTTDYRRVIDLILFSSDFAKLRLSLINVEFVLFWPSKYALLSEKRT